MTEGAGETRAVSEQELEALETYVEYHGAIHVNRCPADDTCFCSYAWVNDGVNSVVRKLAALLASAPAPAAERVAWNSIEAVQPNDGQYCLVWRSWPGRIGVYMFERRQIRWTWQGLYGWDPTHWMPLPLPPAEPPQEPPSFKEGVAYMPVPRCETCKHWEYFTPESESLPDYGLCNNTTSFSGLLALAIREDAWMHKSFGCVQWELKPAEPPQEQP